MAFWKKTPKQLEVNPLQAVNKELVASVLLGEAARKRLEGENYILRTAQETWARTADKYEREKKALQDALASAGVSKAQIDALNTVLSDNAKATAEAGQAIAYAIGALANATERGARAKQREVEQTIKKLPE